MIHAQLCVTKSTFSAMVWGTMLLGLQCFGDTFGEVQCHKTIGEFEPIPILIGQLLNPEFCTSSFAIPIPLACTKNIERNRENGKQKCTSVHCQVRFPTSL
jgi:hypothetical protein